MLWRISYFLLYLIPMALTVNDYLFEGNSYVPATNKHFHYTESTLPKRQKHLHTAPAIYEKEYFFFRAPDDTLKTEAVKTQLIPQKKRHQVIFIKTPMNAVYEKALENILLNSIQHHSHIYIFSQQPNYTDVTQKLQNIQKSIHHKPEVHFIKYHHPREVENLQSTILRELRAANENKPVYALQQSSENTPVSKNYAMNFLPTGVDVVPGSSYIPLYLF